MKICFLGDAESIHIKRWCEFFRDKGDNVSIITFRESKLEGINIINLGKDIKINSNGGNFIYLKKILSIRKLINELKPDIVNAHYLTSYGLLGALSKQAPLVTSTWGSDILVTPHKNIIYKHITQYVLGKSDMITSDSNYMSREIEMLGKKKEDIITAPMGIDNKIFNVDNRNYYNRTLLSMRTLTENSNIDIIIKAFYNLSKTEDDIRLIIANDGSDKEKYANLITELGLNNKIELLGSISRTKVIELLKSNTFYISIPTSDSTSVTLLEAMACGMIPIVSNLPANQEWISDNINGYIINDISVYELQHCLEKALNSFNKYNNFSQINSEIIKERALWEDNMNLIRDSYLKLIKKGV